MAGAKEVKGNTYIVIMKRSQSTARKRNARTCRRVESLIFLVHSGKPRKLCRFMVLICGRGSRLIREAPKEETEKVHYPAKGKKVRKSAVKSLEF